MIPALYLELLERPQNVQCIRKLPQIMIDLDQGQVAPLHQITHVRTRIRIPLPVLQPKGRPGLYLGRELQRLLLVDVECLSFAVEHGQEEAEENGPKYPYSTFHA